jgi:hypothetical protein
MNRTRQCGIHWCVFVVVVILVFLSWLGRSARAQERFPGKEWQRKTPAEVGLNAAQLDEFKRSWAVGAASFETVIWLIPGVRTPNRMISLPR